ncbi:MAG: tryptophan-rich sensory protein [Rhizobiales bacterium]|nr:tryptophan-rich sensory protein [Hyphomicrobiales bacterium]
MERPADQRKNSPLSQALLAVAPVMAAALIGQAFTTPNLAPWYASLVKPAFNPPNGVFAPVWTVLYAMMAYAFWRVLRAPASGARRSRAATFFLTQLGLNALWSIAFFGLQNPALGLVVIVALIAMIVATIQDFLAIDPPAALLMAPYLCWVTFATLLNASIWLLN